MSPAEKKVVDSLRGAEYRRKMRAERTYTLYTIERKRNRIWPYTPPFMATDDSQALSAMVEMSKSHPEICRSNLLAIATWCALDNKITVLKNPRIVKGKPNEN